MNVGLELSWRGIPVYAPCEHRADRGPRQLDFVAGVGECRTHFSDVPDRKHKKDVPPGLRATDAAWIWLRFADVCGTAKLSVNFF